MALVAPGTSCAINSDHNLEVLSLSTPPFGDCNLHDRSPPVPEDPPVAVMFLDPLVHRLSGILAEKDFSRGGGRNCLVIETALATLLSVFLVRSVSPRLQGVRGRGFPPRRLDRVLNFMNENLSEPQTLDQWARVANVSRFHFAKQFRSDTGLPPYEFLLHLRVAGACRRLVLGRKSIAAIAGDFGFADQSHFHRHFRRLLGVTPARFARLSPRVPVGT